MHKQKSAIKINKLCEENFNKSSFSLRTKDLIYRFNVINDTEAWQLVAEMRNNGCFDFKRFIDTENNSIFIIEKTNLFNLERFVEKQSIAIKEELEKRAEEKRRYEERMMDDKQEVAERAKNERNRKRIEAAKDDVGGTIGNKSLGFSDVRNDTLRGRTKMWQQYEK